MVMLCVLYFIHICIRRQYSLFICTCMLYSFCISYTVCSCMCNVTVAQICVSFDDYPLAPVGHAWLYIVTVQSCFLSTCNNYIIHLKVHAYGPWLLRPSAKLLLQSHCFSHTAQYDCGMLSWGSFCLIGTRRLGIPLVPTRGV